MAKTTKVLQADGMNKCIGCYSCMLACARYNFRSYSPRKSAIQIRTRGGLQSKFAAHICIGCRKPDCAKACPTGALTPRPGGGIKFNPDICTGCGACAKACIVQVIHMDMDSQQPITCSQCGICVQFCPHGCLSMKEVPLNAE